MALPEVWSGCLQFYIWDGVDSENCGLLHDEDILKCQRCGYEGSGEEYSAILVRENNLVPCQTCGGTGLIKRDGCLEKMEDFSKLKTGIKTVLDSMAQENDTFKKLSSTMFPTDVVQSVKIHSGFPTNEEVERELRVAILSIERDIKIAAASLQDLLSYPQDPTLDERGIDAWREARNKARTTLAAIKSESPPHGASN